MKPGELSTLHPMLAGSIFDLLEVENLDHTIDSDQGQKTTVTGSLILSGPLARLKDIVGGTGSLSFHGTFQTSSNKPSLTITSTIKKSLGKVGKDVFVRALVDYIPIEGHSDPAPAILVRNTGIEIGCTLAIGPGVEVIGRLEDEGVLTLSAAGTPARPLARLDQLSELALLGAAVKLPREFGTQTAFQIENISVGINLNAGSLEDAAISIGLQPWQPFEKLRVDQLAAHCFFFRPGQKPELQFSGTTTIADQYEVALTITSQLRMTGLLRTPRPLKLAGLIEIIAAQFGRNLQLNPDLVDLEIKGVALIADYKQSLVEFDALGSLSLSMFGQSLNADLQIRISHTIKKSGPPSAFLGMTAEVNIFDVPVRLTGSRQWSSTETQEGWHLKGRVSRIRLSHVVAEFGRLTSAQGIQAPGIFTDLAFDNVEIEVTPAQGQFSLGAEVETSLSISSDRELKVTVGFQISRSGNGTETDFSLWIKLRGERSQSVSDGFTIHSLDLKFTRVANTWRGIGAVDLDCLAQKHLTLSCRY